MSCLVVVKHSHYRISVLSVLEATQETAPETEHLAKFTPPGSHPAQERIYHIFTLIATRLFPTCEVAPPGSLREKDLMQDF